MVPNKPGDVVKTSRRDTVALARLLRAGELSAPDWRVMKTSVGPITLSSPSSYSKPTDSDGAAMPP